MAIRLFLLSRAIQVKRYDTFPCSPMITDYTRRQALLYSGSSRHEGFLLIRQGNLPSRKWSTTLFYRPFALRRTNGSDIHWHTCQWTAYLPEYNLRAEQPTQPRASLKSLVLDLSPQCHNSISFILPHVLTQSKPISSIKLPFNTPPLIIVRSQFSRS